MNKCFRRMALQKIAETINFSADENNIGPNLSKVKKKITLAQILKEAKIGPLTKFVQKELKIDKSKESSGSFREQFLKMSPGKEREDFVFKEIIKRKPIQNLIPITVPGPKGTKITYKVMPDYITIEGVRVPMSGKTAQRVANHFGLSLPTSKMVKQIWETADTKIRPAPLSSGGRIGNRYYSGEEVVSSKIGDSDSAIAYSDMIENQLKDKNPNLIAGHMKSIVLTDQPDKLGLFGWSGDDKQFNPIQSNSVTPHDTDIHTEYGSGARLVDGTVDIELPNGKIITTTLDQLLEHPQMRESVSDGPVRKYNI